MWREGIQWAEDSVLCTQYSIRAMFRISRQSAHHMLRKEVIAVWHLSGNESRFNSHDRTSRKSTVATYSVDPETRRTRGSPSLVVQRLCSTDTLTYLLWNMKIMLVSWRWSLLRNEQSLSDCRISMFLFEIYLNDSGYKRDELKLNIY